MNWRAIPERVAIVGKNNLFVKNAELELLVQPAAKDRAGDKPVQGASSRGKEAVKVPNQAEQEGKRASLAGERAPQRGTR